MIVLLLLIRVKDYSLLIIHFSLFTFHFSLLIIHFSLFTFHYSLLIIHFSLFTFHFSLFTFHFSLKFKDCVFYKVNIVVIAVFFEEVGQISPTGFHTPYGFHLEHLGIEGSNVFIYTLFRN